MNEMNHDDSFVEDIKMEKNPNQKQKDNIQNWIIMSVVIGSILMVIMVTCGILLLKNVLLNHSHFYFSINHSSLGEEEETDEEETYPVPGILPLPDEDMGEAIERDDLEEWEKHLTHYGEKDNPFIRGEFKSHMGTDHDNHSREEFSGAYYETICDSITKNVPYTISRDYYTYADKMTDTQIHVSCVSLEGEITNIDVLNKAIYDKTMFLAKTYLENYEGYQSTKGINIMVDSYVTYNDSSMLSIVLDEYYIIEQKVNIDLYCINADLDMGILLNNAKILKYNETFAKEFKEKSAKQNGADTALAGMSIGDILYLLEDEYNDIIFYTPLGMEVGINYVVNGASGWITVSYSDYQKYVNHL